MAWQRTGVAGTGVAGSALVAAAHRGSAVLVGVTGAVAVLCATAVGLAATRGRSGLPGDSPWVRLIVVAAVPMLTALAGALLALAP